MIIDRLENLYRAEAEESNKKPVNPFRASRSGHCVAAMARDKLGIPGLALQPRRMAVFRHGEIIHRALTEDLGLALGNDFIHPNEFGDDLSIDLEGCNVTLHPDGGLYTEDGRLAVIEIKSMSDYAFDKALEGHIEREYLCQAWVYHKGTSFQVVIFVAYRKETSHMVEIIFDSDASETVVTQRFGADPLKLAREEPLLMVEIRSPFDDQVEAEVRERYRLLAAVKTEADIPPGVMAIEPELIKAQKKETVNEYKELYGEPLEVKGGGWHTWQTGRTIAGFPCSYCRHIQSCLGAELDIKDKKPVWVINGKRN